MTASRRPASPARWALQDAKNRFSEVVDAALRGEPQVVTRRGIETAVIISHDDYTRMTRPQEEPRLSFTSYLVDGPVATQQKDDLFQRIQLRPRSDR